MTKTAKRKALRRTTRRRRLTQAEIDDYLSKRMVDEANKTNYWAKQFAKDNAKIGSTLRIRLPNDFVVSDGSQLAPTVKVESLHHAIRVKIDGVLHLWLPRKNLAVQSWLNGDKYFAIEFIFDGGCVTCEYDDRHKWLAILNGLEQVLWAE